MTNEILKKLKDIKEKLDKSIQDKSVIKLSAYDNMLEDIKKIVALIEEDQNQKEEILRELKEIYKKLIGAYEVIRVDCWDSFKHSVNNSEPFSDKYVIEAAYKNLSTIVEVLKVLHNKDLHQAITGTAVSLDEIKSIQKKMKEGMDKYLGKQQLPQSTANNDGAQSVEPDDEEQYTELEKKAKIEFSQYIENGSIDSVSIEETSSGNLHAKITLHDNQDNKDKNTNIKISELLNNEFCKNNKITSFSLLHSNKEEIISGCVDDKGVRWYDLSKIAPHQMQFNWYIGERECSITLSTDGNRVVVTGCKGLHSMEDLEANNYVQIKIGAGYLSLADTVVSTQLSPPASQGAQQHSRTSVAV